MNAVVERKPPSEIVVARQQLDSMAGQFKAALPAHIPVERFARVVMTAIQNNPQLLAAPRKDLFNAAMKAAQDGLLPDGREGALVLRGSAKRNNLSVTWQPMIAGVRKKARNSGEISTWDAHCVYANDEFQFQLGDAPQINHSYDLKQDRGELVGAYSVCVLKDGTKTFEVMSIAEIRAIRDRSDAWKAFKAGYIKSTPWSTDEAEMARKTVARRHSKVIPMSTDLDDLIRRDDDLYDLKGAQEEAAAGRPKSLAGRLDALAGTETPVEEPDDEPDARGQGQREAGSRDDGRDEADDDRRVGEQQPGEDRQGDDPTMEEARADGADSRRAGRSRKAIPARFRNDDRLRDAWLSGFDGDFDEQGDE